MPTTKEKKGNEIARKGVRELTETTGRISYKTVLCGDHRKRGHRRKTIALDVESLVSVSDYQRLA